MQTVLLGILTLLSAKAHRAAVPEQGHRWVIAMSSTALGEESSKQLNTLPLQRNFIQI